MTAAKPFLLIADDFGMSPGVNNAILALIADGRLSGTGAMVSLPAFEPDAHRLLAMAGQADIGLHVTLTAGAPLTRMPRFAPASHFPPQSVAMARAFTGRIDVSELRAEILSQIRRFVEVMGCRPAFLDGHQHVHVYPGIRRALFEAIRDFDPEWRPFIRNPGNSVTGAFARRIEVGNALVISAFAAGFGRLGRAFPMNDSFSGASYATGPGRFSVDFAGYLRAPGRCHLVMCHPGHVDETLVSLDPLTSPREAELAYLSGDAFAQALSAAGLRIGRLSDFKLRSRADGGGRQDD